MNETACMGYIIKSKTGAEKKSKEIRVVNDVTIFDQENLSQRSFIPVLALPSINAQSKTLRRETWVNTEKTESDLEVPKTRGVMQMLVKNKTSVTTV